MEEKRHIRKEDVFSRRITKEQAVHTGSKKNLPLQGKPRARDVKRQHKKQVAPAARLKSLIKKKQIEELMKADDPTAIVESATKAGINKIVSMVARAFRKMFIASGKLALKLAVMLIPVFIFFAPVIFLTVCIAGFAGSAGTVNRNLTFGITGDLNYVSYMQGNYQSRYNETGWCGITSFADILASYGCTSPYEPSELIDPCDAVKYADENDLAIVGEADGVHYLNEAWYSSLCGEYGLEFDSVRSDNGIYGEALLEWVNEKLDDGWQVVVCFDRYSQYESGAYITRNQHYVWLTCYADSNHETYACIDPGNGCADAAFLPDATTEGGYRDLIVNKSQILDYTGNSNYITGFAVRLPDETDTTEMDEMRYTNSRVITGS